MFSSEKCTFDKNLGFIDQILNAQLVGNFPNAKKIRERRIISADLRKESIDTDGHVTCVTSRIWGHQIFPLIYYINSLNTEICDFDHKIMT